MRANPPRILTVCASVLFVVLFGSAHFVSKVQAYPSGSPAGYTGAPASGVDFGTCASCHGGTATAGVVTVTGFPAGSTYTPGVTQHLTVTVPTSTLEGVDSSSPRDWPATLSLRKGPSLPRMATRR